MAQAHAEFGLGYSLHAYYGCDSGVPTSGAITLGHLYGKKKRTAYTNFALIFNDPWTPNTYFVFGEIEFRETPGGVKFPVNAISGSGSSPSNAVDGNLFVYFQTGGYINQWFSVNSQFGTPRVLRQVGLYITSGNSIPRNVKVYGRNDIPSNSPNPPTMTGWTLIQEINLPAQAANGWLNFDL
ncbi:hypothetical protein [Comamonas sp.]|uniref:hypothetical protein n=1 Tax=Comamonas sp. TaxID=34028 RepID=UPI00289F2AF2|nr:hypothetical protein [Comamonas sp.]